MALLRFDPKVNNFFIEVGWPKKTSAEKNGISVYLSQKRPDKKIVAVRNLSYLKYDKETLKNGVSIDIPEIGRIVVSYEKKFGLFPLVTVRLNGEKLRGAEVLNSVIGEVSGVG